MDRRQKIDREDGLGVISDGFLRQFSDLTVYELVELFKWFMSQRLTDQIDGLMDWWTRALEPAVGGLAVGAGGGNTGVGAGEQWSQQ